MNKVTHLYIEPTNNCNIMCLHCPQPVLKKYRITKNISSQFVDSILNDVPTVKTVTLVGLGEPFLNSEILEIIQILNKREIRVAITTNGLLLNNELIIQLSEFGVRQLSVSLDSTITSLQNKTRKDINVDYLLSQIIKANNSIENMGLPLQINVTMIRTKSLMPSLKQSILKLKVLGIKEILLKNITILNRRIAKQESLIPDNIDIINQIEANFFHERTSPDQIKITVAYNLSMVNGNIKPSCPYKPESSLFITSEGHVYPCYLLALKEMSLQNSCSNRFLLGDLNNTSLVNIIKKNQATINNNFWINPIYECTKCNVFKETYRTYYL